jgi:hypothetical protein
MSQPKCPILLNVPPDVLAEIDADVRGRTVGHVRATRTGILLDIVREHYGITPNTLTRTADLIQAADDTK